MIGILVLVLVAILLQGTLTTLPIAFLVLLSGFVVKKQPAFFYLALAVGIIIDILTIRSIGDTSLFLIVALFAVFLYQRKFEISTYSFCIFFTFVSVLIYASIFVGNNVLLHAIVSVFIEVLLFAIFSKLLITSKETEAL